MSAPFDAVSDRHRWMALGGVVGVGGFVVAWAVSGLQRDGYSLVDDAISRLAESGTPRNGQMAAGFIAFGVGVPVYAQALRRALPGPAWIAATATGLATLGVAAAPLGRADAAHYVFAIAGYGTLAATPLLAAPKLRERGALRWSRVSTAAGIGSAIALAASSVDRGHGLTQRIGLGIVDVWIIASACSMWRRRSR